MNKDRRRTFNDIETTAVRNLDNLALYDEIMPAIRAAARAGGGADALLKQSEILAVLKIIELTGSQKPDVALRAATEILNRAIGKPVERSISVYGDINKMNERDLDSQIARLIKRTGADHLVATALKPALGDPKERKKKAMKVKQPPKETAPAIIDVTPHGSN